jgi:hypothetical protein
MTSNPQPPPVPLERAGLKVDVSMSLGRGHQGPPFNHA